MQLKYFNLPLPSVCKLNLNKLDICKQSATATLLLRHLSFPHYVPPYLAVLPCSLEGFSADDKKIKSFQGYSCKKEACNLITIQGITSQLFLSLSFQQIEKNNTGRPLLVCVPTCQVTLLKLCDQKGYIWFLLALSNFRYRCNGAFNMT